MSTPPVTLRQTSPRAEGVSTGSGTDALASELLLAGGEYAAHAIDHLTASSLGAGNGPQLAGSRRIVRLSQLPDAPPDRNGNGTNLDETLAQESARIAAEAGAVFPSGTQQTLFPWHTAAVDLAQPAGRDLAATPSDWRAVDAGDRRIDVADVGAQMLARLAAAGLWLQQSRGSLAGIDTDRGSRGLALLHQVLAAEESLFDALFTDGERLGQLPDPETYDPANGARWLPAQFTVTLAAEPPMSPTVYRLLDSSSDLLALASVLRAATELARLSADTNPDPAERDLFAGHPFGDAGAPNQPRGSSSLAGAGLSWDRDVGPLMALRCVVCHSGNPPSGNFLADTLAHVAAGSPLTVSRGLVMIRPNDAANSYLYQVLTTPAPGLQRMPQFSSLVDSEIQLIADWINSGANEHPNVIVPPPPPGRTLAAVLFADLVALHFDGKSGALHHRFEGHGGSGVSTAVATGAALRALAALAQVLPRLRQSGLAPADVVAQAAMAAVRDLVRADGRVVEDVRLGAAAGPIGALADQAALVAGLQAALPFAPVVAPALQAAEARLQTFWDPIAGTFRERPEYAGSRLTAAAVADLLAALRASGGGKDAVAQARAAQFLAGLRPVLAFAEWSGGEVIGDGIADTDGNGVPEPAAAGGQFGRLPMLASAFLIGDSAARPPPSERITWTGHVRPLLLVKCAECHMNGGNQGHYLLDTVESLRVAGDSHGVWPLMVPGDPEGSLLYRKVVDRRPPVGDQMPQRRPPLDAHGKDMLRRWILDGGTAR